MKSVSRAFTFPLLTLALFLGVGRAALAVDCNTNCVSHCGISLTTPVCIASCEVQVAASCAAGALTPSSVWTVHVKNDCRYNMQVAAHYLNFNHRWVTDGWWQLTPGEDAQIFQTRNRFVYFFAETTPHGQFKWSGPSNWTVRGREVGFMQKEIRSSGYGRWTEHFNCN